MEVQVWYIVYLRQEDMRAQVAKNVKKKDYLVQAQNVNEMHAQVAKNVQKT